MRPKIDAPTSALYALMALSLALSLFWPVESYGTAVFEFDDPLSEWLGTGWSGAEELDGTTFMWVEGTIAGLEIPVLGARDRLVTFRAWSVPVDEGPPQTVTVKLNGVTIAHRLIGAAGAEYCALAPADAFRAQDNVLIFELRYAVIPSVTDTRRLSAAFDWVRIIDVEPPDRARSP
ncbi:MAG: hypothetical protein AB7S26_25245 [Sandaracinaceae bacterium]